MVSFAQQKVSELQKLEAKKTAELRSQEQSLVEAEARSPGGSFANKRENIRNLGKQLSDIQRQFKFARELESEVGGRDIPLDVQRRAFEQRTAEARQRIVQQEIRRQVRIAEKQRPREQAPPPSPLQPTATEEALQMSLPSDIRGLPVRDVLARQSFGISRAPDVPISLPPTRREELLQMDLPEERLKRIRQQAIIDDSFIQQPIEEDKSRFKRARERASDVFTGLTFGLLEPTATTSGLLTSRDPGELQQELKDIPTRALSRTNILGTGFAGLGFGVRPSGDVGLGFTDVTSALVFEQISTAQQLREEGEKTVSKQALQIKEIKDVSETLKRGQSQLTDTKQFEKDVGKFTKDIETFKEKVRKTEAISNIAAFPEKLKSLAKEEKELLKEQERLTKREGKLSKEQLEFEKLTEKELSGLREIGVESKITEGGAIEFTSEQLGKKVAPVGIKLQKALLKEDNGISVRNVLFGTTALAREAGIAFGVGAAIGGTGIIARIGARVARVPKVGRTVVKGLGLGLVGVGVTTSTVSGFQAGQVEDIGKVGAVIGGLKATGRIAGFGVGALRGTSLRFEGLERQIISGRTSKSVIDIKSGVQLGDRGGFARQISEFETRVPGTDIQIITKAGVRSRFGLQQGVSDIEAVTGISGKLPTGFPTKLITRGQSLDVEKLSRARLFTEVPGAKGFGRQDVLISKDILNVKTIDVTGKGFFEPFGKIQRVDIVSGVKAVGRPAKVQKIPKDIFTPGERTLFRVSEGTQRVAGFGEFAEAKPETLFKSRQFILTTPPKKFGGIDISEFKTISTTRGISTDFLGRALRERLIITDIEKGSISAFPIGKRGQVPLLRPPRFDQQIPKPRTRPSKIDLGFKPSIDTRGILQVQLKDIVPKVIAAESSLIGPTLFPTAAGLAGLREISRVSDIQRESLSLKNLPSSRLDIGLKVGQITPQKVTQAPALKLGQVQRLDLGLTSVTQRVTTTTPIRGGILPPPIFAIGFPSFLPKRKPKKKKGKKKKVTLRRKLAPSFTGIIEFDIAGITGELPKEFESLGVLPGQTRFVPTPRRPKKKKK